MSEDEYTTMRIKRTTLKILQDRCSYGDKPCDILERLLDE